MSCVDELLVSITAVRRIYRLAVRAPGRRLLCRLLVFIFSGASDRGRVGCKASGRRAALECTAPPEICVSRSICAATSCAAKTRPAEVRRRGLLAGPRRLVPHCLLPKTRGCAGFGPKGLPLAQGPAAGRAGASRRETPATAAHRPFAALPKNARLGASAFTRGSPISTTPSFERQASSEGARPRCDSAQRAAFAVPAAPQRCCACYF